MTQIDAKSRPHRLFGNQPVAAFLTRMAILGLVATAGLAVPSTLAQPATKATADKAAEDAKRENLQDLADFVHYVKIARYDLARASWGKLSAKNMTDAAFVDLVESSGDMTRFEDAAQRALRVRELSDVGTAITKKFSDGKLARARNPAEITKNIAALTGTLRGKLMAEERLRAAGEYAMPQLLEAYLNQSNPAMRAEAQRVIIEMGRQAVAPLTAALVKMPPAQQEQVANVLGLIKWRTSLPFLADVAESTKNGAVKEACGKAIERLGGMTGSTSALYAELAEAYYAEKAEVLSFPGEEFQVIWDYVPQSGLSMTAIKTPVFHEAMAMSLSERAIQIEGKAGTANPDTVALWVASNFSREIDTPQGYANPVYPTTGPGARRSAEYYAVASGPDIAQRVLGRALDTKDTPLARRALRAVERTAGVSSLAGTGRMPLPEALAYPNRRVQYEAALAIAAAQPKAAFGGSDRVVPTLASSIRGATQQFAAVIADDVEQYQIVRGVLQKAGYTVMPQGRSMNDLAAPIAEAPAVDVVVFVGQNSERSVAMIAEVRGTTKTAATPILAMISSDAYLELRTRFEGQALVAVRPVGIGADAISATLDGLVTSASGGPISAEEAKGYASRSIAALRDLALSGGDVLKVADAALPLITAVHESQGTMKLDVAEVLSRIEGPAAQRAVMDEALASSGADRVALLGKVAQSAKRFGNQLEARHTARLLELASKGGDDEATAAAALMGALNSAQSDVVPLILGASK